jgi:hypothetical protein
MSDRIMAFARKVWNDNKELEEIEKGIIENDAKEKAEEEAKHHAMTSSAIGKEGTPTGTMKTSSGAMGATKAADSPMVGNDAPNGGMNMVDSGGAENEHDEPPMSDTESDTQQKGAPGEISPPGSGDWDLRNKEDKGDPQGEKQNLDDRKSDERDAKFLADWKKTDWEKDDDGDAEPQGEKQTRDDGKSDEMPDDNVPPPDRVNWDFEQDEDDEIDAYDVPPPDRVNLDFEPDADDEIDADGVPPPDRVNWDFDVANN